MSQLLYFTDDFRFLKIHWNGLLIDRKYWQLSIEISTTTQQLNNGCIANNIWGGPLQLYLSRQANMCVDADDIFPAIITFLLAPDYPFLVRLVLWLVQHLCYTPPGLLHVIPLNPSHSLYSLFML